MEDEINKRGYYYDNTIKDDFRRVYRHFNDKYMVLYIENIFCIMTNLDDKKTLKFSSELIYDKKTFNEYHVELMKAI